MSVERELAQAARAEGRLGIDTEFLPEGRYRALLCLVQVVVGDRIEILDPLQDELDVEPLAAVLADPDVEVVMHAGRQDVALLRREWRTEVRGLFDTQVAAGFAGMSAQSGYLGLLQDVLKIRLDKSASYTRWDQRPLTDEQLRYAAEDVEHLLPLAAELQRRLRERGRLEWALEECRPVEQSTDERDPDEVWRRLPRAQQLSARDRAIARELSAWRERTAEAEDKPVGSILKDPTLLEVIKRKPADRGAMGQIRGLHQDIIRRRGAALLKAIERGRAAEPIPLDEVERSPSDPHDAATASLAEALARARSLEAGLAYELIASRAELLRLVSAVRRGASEPDVRVLRGWRRELVGEALLALLRGEATLHVGERGRIEVT